MKKVELTYAEIETLQFILKSLGSDYYMSESMQKKIDTLYMKLIGMRAQLEYPRKREE
jgi:hypothetical protein